MKFEHVPGYFLVLIIVLQGVGCCCHRGHVLRGDWSIQVDHGTGGGCIGAGGCGEAGCGGHLGPDLHSATSSNEPSGPGRFFPVPTQPAFAARPLEMMPAPQPAAGEPTQLPESSAPLAWQAERPQVREASWVFPSG